MAITEQHFSGFNIRKSYDPLQSCPLRAECWTHVWYERWHFWGNTLFRRPKIGVAFTNAYACFDVVGNKTGVLPIITGRFR